MKKSISVPIIGSLIFAALSFLSTAADLTVHISEDLILGPWEVFNAISAALFGPIGVFITELGLDVSAYLYLIKDVYPPPQDLYFMIGNYVAHCVIMLVAAFGYRYIHGRMKMPGLLAGWFFIMVAYYLLGVPLSVWLHNWAVPGLETTIAGFFSSVRLEFVLVTVITSLILLALPERYRKPRWW